MAAALISSSAATAPIAPFDMSLFDPGALLIVLAGTMIATIARAGLGNIALTVRCLAQFVQTGFDENANRIALARWVEAVRKSGILGADVPFPPDISLSRALDGLVRTGSLCVWRDLHAAARAQRITQRSKAAEVFEQAGELAPVFGLVGTLFAMTQMSPGGVSDPSAATFAAIATAVLSSLYGVLTAHLICFPTAGAIARRSAEEEEHRDALATWLAEQITDFLPKQRVENVPHPENAVEEGEEKRVANLKSALKSAA